MHSLSTDKATRRVQLLLEVGLVLLTIHLISGSTWLHHFIDLGVPILGLLGAWWLSARHNLNWRTALLYGIALGLAYAALLNRPLDWLMALTGATNIGALPALLMASLGTLVLLGLWAGIAVALLRSPSIASQPSSA